MQFQNKNSTSALSLNTSLPTLLTTILMIATTTSSTISTTTTKTNNTTTNTITTTTNNNTNTNSTTTNDNTTLNHDLSEAEHSTQPDEEGFVSDQALHSFMAVFQYMMPVLCGLAVAFCFFNAAVYWQQRPARFALYLVAVDLGDGLCSLVELLHSVVYFSLPADNYGHLVVKWYLAKYVAASCRRAAVCLNAFASLERFLAIAFPLKSVTRRVCARPGAIIAAMFVTSLTAHVYFALEYEVARTGSGSWNLAQTRLRREHPRAFALWSLADSIVFAYSPLVAIVVLNTTLVIVLRAHTSSLKSVRRVRGKEASVSSSVSQTSRGDSSGLIVCGTDSSSSVARNKAGEEEEVKKKQEKKEKEKKKENQTTKMVVVFSTVFFLMALPRMLNSSARSILEDYGPKGKEKNLYHALGLVSQITSHLTETALFWVAVAYSRSFRRSVLGLPVTRWLLGPCLVGKSSLPATTSVSSDVSTSNVRGGSSVTGWKV